MKKKGHHSVAEDSANISTSTYFQSGVVTSLMLATAADPKSAERCFWSLLACPGTLVYRASAGAASARYVVESTPYGVVLFKSVAKLFGGQRVLQLDLEARDAIYYEHILDPADWYVQTIVEEPPAMSEERSEILRHLESTILPEEAWPRPLPRCCHMISEEDELELIRR